MADILFFAHEYVDRGSVEIPVFSYFVLQVSPIWFFDPLREVTEEYECGDRRAFEHGHVFYAYEFTFVGWRGICRDYFEHHCVEL